MKLNHRIAKQMSLPVTFPIVRGNKDYDTKKEILENIDALLRTTGIEESLTQKRIVQVQSEMSKKLNSKEILRVEKATTQALRCNIVRCLSGESFRDLAFHLGESYILQKFCGLVEFDRAKIPGKSTLQNFSDVFSQAQIRAIVNQLNLASQKDLVPLGEKPDLSVALVDSTCLETNIHYPVDWVLLRDAVRTLTKAISCIREHGLRHRIQDPKTFLTKMNGYCMAMTQHKRQQNAKQHRKDMLRLMKNLARCVEKHALKYRNLLDRNWQETDLSRPESEVILKRMDNILTQLPQAVKQAHERIIGERLVANADKILSLYETHTQVYNRGKAGQESEFGLQLLVGESADGIILDWDLVNGSPKNDSQHVQPCVNRLKQAGIDLTDIVGDRGFASEKNKIFLSEEKIGDHLCPRNVIEFRQKLTDKKFSSFQKRRAQTEARISILKNRFIGSYLPTKGIEHQEKHVALNILTHNLWLLARMIAAEKAATAKAAKLKQAA